jgi:serine/threonine protein kinase
MPQPVDVRNILGKSLSDPRLEELYTLDKQIGKGAFGVVRLGHHKATGEPVAVKSISKAKLTCKEDIQDVQAEVAIMNLVAGHGNVVMLQVRAGHRRVLGQLHAADQQADSLKHLSPFATAAIPQQRHNQNSCVCGLGSLVLCSSAAASSRSHQLLCVLTPT